MGIAHKRWSRVRRYVAPLPLVSKRTKKPLYRGDNRRAPPRIGVRDPRSAFFFFFSINQRDGTRKWDDPRPAARLVSCRTIQPAHASSRGVPKRSIYTLSCALGCELCHRLSPLQVCFALHRNVALGNDQEMFPPRQLLMEQYYHPSILHEPPSSTCPHDQHDSNRTSFVRRRVSIL